MTSRYNMLQRHYDSCLEYGCALCNLYLEAKSHLQENEITALASALVDGAGQDRSGL